ncbi:MAG: hypothetical protein E6H07_18065 [Bacteroidetes bacterium]|nr:MAG: hypothetical protein E6H07_18065 [Bacteroidota bacterium]
MKSYFLIAVFFICRSFAFAQGNAPLIPVPLIAPAQPLFLRDYFTTPVKIGEGSGIGGSPFIFDDWLLANIRFMDDKKVDSIRIKINTYQNKVHYRDENGEELQAIGKFKEIKIIDNSSSWNGTVFFSGFEKEKNAFFQMMADGKKVMLLKKVKVIVWETKAMFEEAKKEFQKENEFYFYVKYELIRQNKSCSQLTDAFKNEAGLLDFISTNDLKCNKEDDMKRIVDFINSK